jgi:hypothetical protein
MFRSGRNRLPIYMNQDKEKDVQKWKEQAADLLECQGTGCSAVEGTGCGSIRMPRNRVFRCGRNKLLCFSEWKELQELACPGVEERIGWRWRRSLYGTTRRRSTNN